MKIKGSASYDFDSILIEGTSNVLNCSGRGIARVFWMWVHKRTPLNLQWPVLENTCADFHHRGLLILCSKNVIGLY